MGKPTVIEAVRRFLPAYLSGKPPLNAEQRRAIWAMQACRTAELGGHVHGCAACKDQPAHYAYHSCNHKACPQCGKGATQQWVQKQELRRIDAPHFMVTFTAPEELRPLFFGHEAKQAFGMLFNASATALTGTLERNKHLRITKSGFTMVLHTWNQKMMFHPHIHVIVPGAGLDAEGIYREVKSPQFLVALAALKSAYRFRFRELMDEAGWQCDPAVWTKKWGINIQAFGDGANAIKYLAPYVSRSVMGDGRIVSITDTHVTFRWKDRANGNAGRLCTLPGVEYVKRYLRHVLPAGMHSIRYCGFHHPTALKTLDKVKLCSGTAVPVPGQKPEPKPILQIPECPCCGKPMMLLGRLPPLWKQPKRKADTPARAPPKS